MVDYHKKFYLNSDDFLCYDKFILPYWNTHDDLSVP